MQFTEGELVEIEQLIRRAIEQAEALALQAQDLVNTRRMAADYDTGPLEADETDLILPALQIIPVIIARIRGYSEAPPTKLTRVAMLPVVQDRLNAAGSEL